MSRSIVWGCLPGSRKYARIAGFMYTEAKNYTGCGEPWELCICSYWLIHCCVIICLLPLAILDIRYGRKEACYLCWVHATFSVCTNPALIGALIVKYSFIPVQTSVQTARWISWGSLTIGPWRCYRSRVAKLEDDLLLVWPVLDSPDVSASLASVIFEVVIKDIW